MNILCNVTPRQIVQRRRELALSQRELGERLGVTRQTISNWETGARQVEAPAMLDLALRWLEEEHDMRD